MSFDKIFEANSIQPLIVVDVQPEYAKSYAFAPRLMEFINGRFGRRTLMLVNAENTGVSSDSKQSIIEYWLDEGLEQRCLRYMNIQDKGYGYLRAWMDYKVPEELIIKVIRYMARNKLNDSRDIPERTMARLFQNHIPSHYIFDDPITINWMNFRSIGHYNNCLLCGGAKNECLREVTIMFDAYNIKYTLLERFIYQ